MIPPGTVLNSSNGLLHDELFFIYDAYLINEFRQLLGSECFRGADIFINSRAQKIIQDIRNSLDSIHDLGAADHLDQLALMLITELSISLKSGSPDTGRMNLKIHELAAKLENGLDITELCRQYGLSKRSFYREWHRVFMISPVQYILEKKLASAEMLILQSNNTIAEIAEKCGFSSTVYFHQRFKKRNSCSPMEYRAQYSASGSRSILPE